MSDEGGWLYIDTEELAAKMPRDAYMVDADRRAFEGRLIKFKTDSGGLYMVVPPLPFYAWHPTFDHWSEREVYRLAGTEVADYQA